MPELAENHPGTAAASAGLWSSRAARRIAVLAVFGTVIMIAPWFLDAYTVNILVRAFFIAIVAVTVDILWGYSGYLTFGQAAFFGLGAYTLAITFSELGFGTGQATLALGGAMVLAALLGALIGWLSFYPGASPFYATIISLVLPIVLVQLIYSGGNFTGASSGVVGYFSFPMMTETWFRVAGIIMLGVAVLAHVALSSDAGRLLRALRDNEVRCAYLGINTAAVRIILLTICAAVAALAGAGYAGFGGIAAPENAGFVFGTQLVVMVALGGRGMLIGAIVGALSIELASAYLSGILPYVWELLVGIAFVAVIVLMPSGLFGLLRATALRWMPWAFASLPEVHLETGPPKVGETAADAVVLEARGVTRRFGALTVLNGVNLTARRGELVSLVGPNGAGKTTLMKCLADGREATAGDIRIAGTPIDGLAPHRIVGLGLGRKFQAASVFETLSVSDCLRIARASRDKPSVLHSAPILTLPAASRSVVEASGLDTRLDQEARYLSHGLKQALELAMVLALEPDLVLLDEPTAGLTRAERQGFADILTRLVEQERLCVLIVEHDLDFVRQISSRIVVLHQGELVLDGTVDEVVNSPLVAEIYSGHQMPCDAAPATLDDPEVRK